MKEIKKALCLLLTAVIVVSMNGCTKGTAEDNKADTNTGNTGAVTSEAKDSNTITITDDIGDKVTLPADIKRIVVCDILPLPSVLSVFFDSADKIVGMSDASMSAAKNSLLSELYPEILNAKTGFINGSEVNVEELTKLEPDVVFYNASSTELGDQLKNAGFHAVAISVNKWKYNCIETLNNWIALLSSMFPENNKTEIVKNYSEKVYQMVQKRVADLSETERARVFFLFKYSEDSIDTSGKQFFGEWWAESIGAVNTASSLMADNSVTVNMEQIYQWNPEIIFITNFTTAQPEDLYNNTIGNFDWSEITAVKNRKTYKMPLGMYRSYTPGVDTPVTLMWLAKTVYPKLFEDIDITKETKDYYKTVFGIDLTDKQAEAIFNPSADAASGF